MKIKEDIFLTDEEWLAVARKIAKDSLCKKSKYSCIIVDKEKNKSVFGVNGPEIPTPLCSNCKRKNIPSGYSSNSYKECPFPHAEEKACEKIEKGMNNLYAYIFGTPCKKCCEVLIKAGIKKVIFIKTHNFLEGLDLLKKKNIEVISFKEIKNKRS